MAKTTLTVPAGGGPVEAVSTIETIPAPYWTRSKMTTGTGVYMYRWINGWLYLDGWIGINLNRLIYIIEVYPNDTWCNVQLLTWQYNKNM